MEILVVLLGHLALGSLACMNMGPLEALTMRSLVVWGPLSPCVVL